MQIDGVSALVVGGASGLGEATARELAAAGATVTIADLNEAAGKAIAEEIGGRFVTTDVTDEDQVVAAVAAAVDAGTLRISVCCAGIGPPQRIVSRDGTPHPLALYEKVIDINQIGTFNVLRLAAAAMSSNDPLDDGERGLIVNTASIAAYEGQVGQIAYASSKGAIVGMTLAAARDLAQLGIRVCTIAPGLFDTPLLASLPADAREGLVKDIVFPKRLGLPGEFARLVRTFAELIYLNGEVVRLDAALRMPPR